MILGNGNNLCNFDDKIIKNSLSRKIGLTIYNNLYFSDHISNICKTANQKLNDLFQVSASMNSDYCSLLINSFIKPCFSYCPLIWMFCNRKSMKKVNRIQGCYLRLMTKLIVINEICQILRKKSNFPKSTETLRNFVIYRKPHG